MKVSVNILTWNCFAVLHETLHNFVDDLKGIEHEVIIVDNGSTDGSEKLATIANKVNLGISQGKNQGIDISKGEYIFMLDGDVLYVPGSLKHLIEWLDNNPAEYAIGLYPNKFTNQRNEGGVKHYETHCANLCEIKPYTATCLYYGLYRKALFDQGIRCPTDGPFALPGYGWEDMDFFAQMKAKGIAQWVAGVNTPQGRYYHAINSSIKLMGTDEYIRTSRERANYFKTKWIAS